MKLTNYIRDAFVTSVMNDVPLVDYAEQVKKIALDDIVGQLPPKLLAVWKDKDLRPFLETTTFYVARKTNIGGVTVPGTYDTKWTLTPGTQAKVDALVEKFVEQRNKRESLQQRVRSVAYGCSTRKALAEALPEFARYLPLEVESARSLPVIANVVADFVKAGWPKDKTAAA